MALDKALKTDLSSLAQIIQSKGRGRDTVLAHITPQEAALLKRRGGRGSVNPDTGLPEFEDDLGGDIPAGETVEQVAASNPDLYAGGELPSGSQSTVYGATGPYYTSADQPVITSGAESYKYEGDAMGGPASVGPAIAYTGQGREVPIQSAYQLTPEGTDVKPIEQTSSAGDVLKQLKGAVPSMSNEALARLGLVGALGTYGAMQGKKAGTQAEQATAQKSAIAAPYKQQGQELIGAAQRGELTQANQQVIQQQRARLAQASSNMGGVGQQQIENQISSLTAQLLDNQYKYGLQVLQIGDNIELGAINTQLQLDQQLNAANRSFYSSLAQLAAGSPMYVPGLTTVTPTRG